MVASDVGRYATESLALERLLSHATDEHKRGAGSGGGGADRNSREDTIAELARKERFDRGLVHLLFRAFVRRRLFRVWFSRSVLPPVYLCSPTVSVCTCLTARTFQMVLESKSKNCRFDCQLEDVLLLFLLDL
jgi:hypothetical protein